MDTIWYYYFFPWVRLYWNFHKLFYWPLYRTWQGLQLAVSSSWSHFSLTESIKPNTIITCLIEFQWWSSLRGYHCHLHSKWVFTCREWLWHSVVSLPPVTPDQLESSNFSSKWIWYWAKYAVRESSHSLWITLCWSSGLLR
jgi:hypothetical protein